MTRTLLDNARWNFSTMCFVCGPDNPHGLRVPFYHDDESHEVTASFTPEPHHSGAPQFGHGGISLALLDEGMAWAVIAVAHRFGLTRRSNATFNQPLRVGQPYEIVCNLESHEEPRVKAKGRIIDASGTVCVESEADYHVLTMEQAEAAIGQPSEQARGYVVDDA